MKTSNFFCNTLALSIILVAVTPGWLMCMDGSNKKRTYSQTGNQEQDIDKSSINYLLNNDDPFSLDTQYVTKSTHYVCKTCTAHFQDNDGLMNHYFPTINPGTKISSSNASDCFKSIVYTENKCPLCNVDVLKKNLWSHIDADHVNAGRFQCSSCSYSCPSEKMLNQHSYKQHNKEKRYIPNQKKILFECEVCKETFHDNDSIANHYFPNNLLHKPVSAKKTFKSLCFEKLPVSENKCRICHLKVLREFTHINKVHIKPIACQYCAFRAGEKKDLVGHVLKHHQAKLVLNSQSIEQHTSARPIEQRAKTQFTCAQCTHVFDTESAYQKHECDL